MAVVVNGCKKITNALYANCSKNQDNEEENSDIHIPMINTFKVKICFPISKYS